MLLTTKDSHQVFGMKIEKPLMLTLTHVAFKLKLGKILGGFVKSGSECQTCQLIGLLCPVKVRSGV